MNICVCIKQIHQVYAQSGRDPEYHFLNPEDIICRINPYDEAALALALQIKTLDASVQVSILTMGPLLAEEALRNAFALGADKLYRIQINEDRKTEPEQDSWRKSELLARAAKMIHADLVLCGKVSMDNQNGLVGAFMARHLGWPFVSSILDLEMAFKEGRATVRRNAGKGTREVVQCAWPAVFSVDITGRMPDIATLERRKQARCQVIETIALDDAMPAKLVSERVFPPRPRVKVLAAPDNRMDAYNRIRQLLSGSTTAKKGKMVSGTAADQVDEMIGFLNKHGFLSSENK